MAQPKPGAGRVKAFDDPSLDDIILVNQLDSDIWTDGIAIRPSGHALATALESPDLFLIDLRYEHSSDDSGSDSGAPPKLIQKFPEANSSINICRLRDTEYEEYAVSTAHVDIPNREFHNLCIWRVSFGPKGEDTPTISKIADIPDGIFGFGMVHISRDVLLVADSMKGCIWRVHIPTGTPSILFEDPDTMLPCTKEEAFAMNRIQVAVGYIWYTNTSSGIVYRAPVEHIDDGRDIRVTGPPKIVAEGCPNNDGLVVRKDGGACFVVSYALGFLWRVDVDPETGTGTPIALTEDLISPTAMELVYYPTDEKPTLYIACCGAWYPEQLAGDRGEWLNLTNVDKSKLRVHVTWEMTVKYESAESDQ